MLCCDQKMKCTYTLPLWPENMRYRTYTCLTCKKKKESLEVPGEHIKSPGLVEMMKKARERRFMFSRATLQRKKRDG